MKLQYHDAYKNKNHWTSLRDICKLLKKPIQKQTIYSVINACHWQLDRSLNGDAYCRWGHYWSLTLLLAKLLTLQNAAFLRYVPRMLRLFWCNSHLTRYYTCFMREIPSKAVVKESMLVSSTLFMFSVRCSVCDLALFYWNNVPKTARSIGRHRACRQVRSPWYPPHPPKGVIIQ